MTRTDQSVFKNMVREVVQEENSKLESRLWSKLRHELHDELAEMVENTFEKYKNITLTKMDEFIKEVRDYRQEQIVRQVQHDRINERLEPLEKFHPHIRAHAV